MSDESRFDGSANRNPLDEQTVTEDEPPSPVDAVTDGGTTDEDEADETDPQQARERREGTGDSLETEEDEA
ncbi:hypothetical protein [Halopiger goleimassiliensis]|uniref:hypothetical protein n=1 Tax=Halopiger goleimassiliensis TaxID=1293048 RepID=UPI000677BEEF|nr:hypothetical protein [Halopiger goleimassiliensis]